MTLGTNNWDVETYGNKLEKLTELRTYYFNVNWKKLQYVGKRQKNFHAQNLQGKTAISRQLHYDLKFLIRTGKKIHFRKLMTLLPHSSSTHGCVNGNLRGLFINYVYIKYVYQRGQLRIFRDILEGAKDPFLKNNDTTPAFLKHTQLCEWQLEGAIHKLLYQRGRLRIILKFIRGGKGSIFKR